jgi:hypothetical protein
MKRPDWIYLQWEGEMMRTYSGEEYPAEYGITKAENEAYWIERAEAAEARVVELERVLRMVEWIRRSDMVPGYCPWCDNDKPDGHAPDCPQQAVLNE